MTMCKVSSFTPESLNAVVAPTAVRDMGGLMLSTLTRCRRVRCRCNSPWLDVLNNRTLNLTFNTDTLESAASHIPDQISNRENTRAYGTMSRASD